MTWRWLNEAVVLAMHDELIAEHGGGAGVRDAGLLSSALARPANHRASGVPDVFALAAACAAGIIWEHPFLAGDKRTGFLAAYLFLHLNGWELNASEPEAVAAALALATKEMAEPHFAAWLKERSVPLKEPESGRPSGQEN